MSSNETVPVAEPYTDACETVVDVFARVNDLDLPQEHREAYRRFLKADLVTKSEKLHPDLQLNIWERAQRHLLPIEVKERLRDGRTREQQPDIDSAPRAAISGAKSYEKSPADIVIITVLPEEFDAVLAAFDLDASKAHQIRGGKYCSTHLRRSPASDLVVYVTMVGQPRNVNCVNVCRDVFERYAVGACILVGIGGGNKKKVRIGDVVASELLFDVAGGTSEIVWKFFQRVQPRLLSYSPPTNIWRNILNLNPLKHDWGTRYSECMAKFRGVKTRKAIDEAAFSAQPVFHRGVIIVGEQVLRDGSIPKHAKRHSDQIMAVDMEGSGFASACDHCGIPWLEIRGISDFGDPEKRDGWHIAAAVAAATCARIFLEKEYLSESEVLQF